MYSEHATSLLHQSMIITSWEHSSLDSTAEWYLDHSGWDCYKENRFLEILSDSVFTDKESTYLPMRPCLCFIFNYVLLLVDTAWMCIFLKRSVFFFVTMEEHNFILNFVSSDCFRLSFRNTYIHVWLGSPKLYGYE